MGDTLRIKLAFLTFGLCRITLVNEPLKTIFLDGELINGLAGGR
jgi:hypothetical protein